MQIRSFISKNLIAIVMVPIIIGGHYTWYRLQKDDRLVSSEDRKKLPLSSLLFGNKPFYMDLVAAYTDWSEMSQFDDQVQIPPYTGEDFFNYFS